MLKRVLFYLFNKLKETALHCSLSYFFSILVFFIDSPDSLEARPDVSKCLKKAADKSRLTPSLPQGS